MIDYIPDAEFKSKVLAALAQSNLLLNEILAELERQSAGIVGIEGETFAKPNRGRPPKQSANK